MDFYIFPREYAGIGPRLHGFGRIGEPVGFGIFRKFDFSVLLKSKVVPVIIIQGESAEETPIKTGIPLTQRTV